MYVCIYDPPPLIWKSESATTFTLASSRSLVWVNDTQNSGLVSFARGSRLPFVQISSIYRKTTAKAWNCYQRWLWRNGTRISVWNIPSGKKKQDYLFRCSLTSGHFPLEWPKKSCFIYFSTGFSRNLFVNGKQPLILVTGRSRSLECLRRNSVASTNLVKILPTAKMAGELGIVVAFYYY